MITFQLETSGRVPINEEMTGLWSLALCLPMDKYVLAEDALNYVEIESYNPDTREVIGMFALTLQNDEDPDDVIEYRNGWFGTKLGKESFTYCIEG